MSNQKKGKYIGIVGASIVHIAIIALLLWIGITVPEPQEESGVPVLLGYVDFAQGTFDPESLNADHTEAQDLAASETVEVEEEQHIITQTEEESVEMPTHSEAPKEIEAKPEPTEAEKEAEAKRLAEEKAEQERRRAAEAAAQRVSGAFGKGDSMGSKGESEGEGVEGVVTGNADTGKKQGIGGYGDFDLSGRSIGPAGLPRPVYNVQDEGVVVINILVNPEGQVIGTSLNPKTNTVNPSLRKAAEDAAKKARFNTVSGVNNQTGTITYKFNLK